MKKIFFQTFKLKNVKKQYTCTTLVVHTTDIRLDWTPFHLSIYDVFGRGVCVRVRIICSHDNLKLLHLLSDRWSNHR